MNFAEYQSPETIEIVTTWGQTVLVVAGVVAAMGAFMRWVGKRWDHRVEDIADALTANPDAFPDDILDLLRARLGLPGPA